jgi:RNA 3'-phosphate cyclase
MIELDGSYGEGGGALVRVALALSTLTGKEFKVVKIRAGREKGGLKAQHIAAINALKQMTNAETNEVSLGSTELYFKPGRIKRGKYEIDIGTAGSITLMLQALILPMMFAPGKVTLKIKGGTCGKGQASVDYLQQVLLPQLRRFVDKIELRILKRGYYPAGGGEVVLEITPKHHLTKEIALENFLEELNFKVPKINLIEQGKLEQIKGVVNVSSELAEKEIAERIVLAAENCLKKHNVGIMIRKDYSASPSIGGEILLLAIFSKNGKMDFDNPTILGSSVLVEKGKSSEEIGKETARKLAEAIESGAGADVHLADQLIQFMGLLPGSEIDAERISEHTNTNIYVVEKFLQVGFKVTDRRIQSKLIC